MKIVGFSILAIAIVSGTEANPRTESCTPGERMTKDCNACFCIDGSRYVCTKNVCAEGTFNEDGTLKDPLSGLILRDKRQSDPTERTCEPGKAFKHYCNNCRCGNDGLVKSAACTKMACPEGMFNEDGTTNEPHGDPVARSKRQAAGADAACVPGTSFKWYCNTCRCGNDGSRRTAACTRIGCHGDVWNEDGSLKVPLSDPIPRDKRQTDGAGATCVPGTSFKIDCNTCHCPPNGLRASAACTLIGCLTGEWNADGSSKAPLSDPIPRNKRQTDGAGATCVPGTSFKIDCNTCSCPANGLRASAACTLIGCLTGTWNADGSPKAPLSDPIPRDKRQTDGAVATCVPETSFKYYCNTCHCPPNGLRASAACTLMGCPEGVWNEDGSLKTPLSDPIPRDKRQTDGAGATCVPGTTFKKDCNTCSCPDNGLRASAACTLIGCL